MTTHTATVDFAEVASAYRKMQADESVVPARHHRGIADAVMSARNTSFSGDSVAGMLDKLDHGYTVPGMKITGANTRNRRKLRYNEDDGEFQIDRALAGDDAIYLERKPRKRQRGIKLEIELGFRGTVPASVLEDYAVWIGKLITGLDGGGFQLQIDVVSRCTSAIKAARLDTHIRVRKFAERGSMRSWSALLSPGGFRHLVFCSRVLAADKAGQTIGGMGGSVHPSWDLKWDPSERKLLVSCHSMARNFPRAEFDRKLAEIKF